MISFMYGYRIYSWSVEILRARDGSKKSKINMARIASRCLVILSLSCVSCIMSTSSSRKVAIVTGGTRGVGAGIASALADDDFDLLLTYNTNLEAAKAFVADLESRHDGIQCELVGGDLSLPETRNAIFECFDSHFAEKVLGAVVHNAGQYVGITSSNEADLPPAQIKFGDGSILGEDGVPKLDHMKYYQRLYGDAFVDLCERGIARMQNGGSLIGISSPGCNLLYNANAGYAMPGSGKSMMEYSMRLFALGAASKNINCNVVIPGVTLTEAWGKVAEKRGMKSEQITDMIVEKRVPMNRPIEARGIGDVVAFLCSDKGRYVTGVVLPVDGGLHLG